METLTQYNVGSIFAYYASMTAFLTLIKQFYHQFVPDQIRECIDEKIKEWFSKQKILDPKTFTLVINQYYNEDWGSAGSNSVYNACEAYLTTKLRSLSTRLMGYRVQEGPLFYNLAQGEEYTEYITLDENNKNVKLHWKFTCKNDKGEETDSGNYKSFELSIDPRYKDVVLDYYIPTVIVKEYDKLIEMNKEIYLYTYNTMSSRHWNPVDFKHPFTFDALALDPELKKLIIDDLDRFITRREFYKKIGRAWKRGYLLYGPPGTGKSSLIAAIANYLKFSVYDLQLASIQSDSTLRNLMMSISNKSILVIEDIDCASGLSRNVVHTRGGENSDDSSYDYDNGDCNADKNGGAVAVDDSKDKVELSLSLSGLLNFIDGLWSSCGDERIIIITTNYKERLDPALLRPGRMDMHIHMSYLKMPGFRILAFNYLDLTEHPLFAEIEELLDITDVSPAEAAEELIRSEDPDVALNGVLKMLKQKKVVRKKVVKNKEAIVGDEHEPFVKNQENDGESISDVEDC